MTLALALLALAQDPGFPLEPGARWTYGRGGREGLMVEVAGSRTVRGIETTCLRVRNGSFFWTEHDLFVSPSDRRLSVLATSYGDSVFEKDPPRVLLGPGLEAGARWDSAIRARVLARERVEVPAGTFEAWKIEYQLAGHLGTEYDFRAWFVPGTGFVKFEYFQQSTLGEKTPLAKPWTVELLRFRKDRKLAPAAFPELDAAARARVRPLLAALSDDRPDVRERAGADLVGLGRGVIPFLRTALDDAQTGLDAKGRIGELLARFPDLQVLGTAVRTRIRVGAPLPVQFRLKNPTERPLKVLPALDGSSRGARLPACLLEIRDEAGELQTVESSFCATLNSLRARDFIELLPGESLPPFWHPLNAWTPSRPGTYRVTFTYDTLIEDPAPLRTPGNVDPEALLLLETLPRGRFVSDTLVVTVDP